MPSDATHNDEDLGWFIKTRWTYYKRVKINNFRRIQSCSYLTNKFHCAEARRWSVFRFPREKKVKFRAIIDKFCFAQAELPFRHRPRFLHRHICESPRGSRSIASFDEICARLCVRTCVRSDSRQFWKDLTHLSLQH